MNRLVVLFVGLVGAAAPVLGQSSTQPQPSIQRIARTDAAGTAASVRTPDAPLVFTRQFSAANTTSSDPRTQADGALDALGVALEKSGSDLGRVLRLNAYVTDDDSAIAVDLAIASRFAQAPPALTLIRSPLTQAGARVAFDAVAASSRNVAAVTIQREGTAVLPAGGKVFVSGQAADGADLAASVRLTMAELFRTIEHLGLTPKDVVQVKAFIQPFADHADAAREVNASFKDGGAPPVVLAEWSHPRLTEIELIAAAKAPPADAVAGKTISYLPLPWLKPASRFSYVTYVAAGTPLIFLGAVSGNAADAPREQMKTLFERQGSMLFEAGSSYRNLAKATYYLADPAAHAVLSDIRGVYFDPARPPAASAVPVGSGLGRPGRAAVVDMIAVPAEE